MSGEPDGGGEQRQESERGPAYAAQQHASENRIVQLSERAG